MSLNDTHSDFPLSFMTRESEMAAASNIAAAHHHVHRFFEALL